MVNASRAQLQAQTERMRSLSEEVAARQTAVSTGRRFARASDEPAAARQAATLARRGAAQQDALAGLEVAGQRLTAADSALGAVNDQIVRLRELALQARSDTADDGLKSALAAEARELSASVLRLMNGQDASGNSLFAGARASAPAFARDAATGAVRYQGFGEPDPIGSDDGTAVAAGFRGDRLLALPDGSSAFDLIDGFAAALTPPADPAAALTPEQRAATLDATIAGAGALVDQLASARASAGARLARIETERDAITAENQALIETRSALTDADLAAEITSMQRAMLLLDASRQTYAQVSRLSLFDQLR